MGFMVFIHTLFISISSLLFTNCFICVVPCPIWSEGSERSSFLISCFSLDSETLSYQEAEAVGWCFKWPGMHTATEGICAPTALSADLCLLVCGKTYSIHRAPARWHHPDREQSIKPPRWALPAMSEVDLAVYESHCWL